MRKRLRSFKYAFRGIWIAASSEANFQIHLAAAAAVAGLGLFLGISRNEWLAVLLCFGAVMSAEAFNSAIERLVDLVSPEFNDKAGQVKDVAAGAVLLSAIAAAVIGCLIFLPAIRARAG